MIDTISNNDFKEERKAFQSQYWLSLVALHRQAKMWEYGLVNIPVN